MKKWKEIKDQNQQIYNDFSKGNIFYAFSKEQFDEGMKAVGAKDVSEICSIGYGGYLLESKRTAFRDLVDQIRKNEREALADDETLLDAFVYELGNHEYCITGDIEDTLEAVGFSENALDDERILRILKSAIKIYEGSVK